MFRVLEMSFWWTTFSRSTVYMVSKVCSKKIKSKSTNKDEMINKKRFGDVILAQECVRIITCNAMISLYDPL